MPKYEVVAEKMVWGVAAIFVTMILLSIAVSLVDNHYPELLDPPPEPERQPERVLDMPRPENIKLVLDRDEVRNPGDRVKNALKECIGRPPALIGVSGKDEIEKFLADATEKDLFFFYCSSPESWKTLAGRVGFVKIRDGKPIDDLILYMN